MTTTPLGHDPLCEAYEDDPYVCICREVAQARADERERTFGDAYRQGATDERERIARAIMAPFESLFSGGPDTPCRTTWPDGVECVEVPMTDLRAAFDAARIARGRFE